MRRTSWGGEGKWFELAGLAKLSKGKAEEEEEEEEDKECGFSG